MLRRYFGECGVPEEISVDGGTNLVSAEMRTFLDRWGVTVRQSSAGYPQSNGRAEAAVKSAKAILRGNTSASGSVDTDKALEALIQYHNTPLRDGDKSPAQLLMGRQLRGGVPVAKVHLLVDEHWKEHLREREVQMARRILKTASPAAVRQLPYLHPGQAVLVQNERTKRWDRTGVITQARSSIRQYSVKLDGSGRLVLRNRRFLRPLLVRPELGNATDPPIETLPRRSERLRQKFAVAPLSGENHRK